MITPDDLSIAMQEEIINISETRLGRSLPADLIIKIKRPWGYMGLEMIMDTVTTIGIDDLELYLANLDKQD